MGAYIHSDQTPNRPKPARHTVKDLVAMQAAIRADLSRRILWFCRQRGIAPTTFGTLSVRDARLIHRLSDERTVMGHPILRQVERYLEDNENPLSESVRR